VRQKRVIEALDQQLICKDAAMTRRCVTLANGLLLGALIATSARAQESTQRPSLADRMSALRRSWAATEPTGLPEEQSQASSPNSAQQPESTATQNRSLIPNWLSHRNDKSATNNNSRQPTNASSRQPSNKMQPVLGAGQNSASARQMPPDPAATSGSRPQADWLPSQLKGQSSTSLPGMGGSPMPRAGSATPRPASSARTETSGGTTTQNAAAPRTQSQKAATQAKPDASLPRLDAAASSSNTTPSSSTPSNSTSNTTSPTRRSPNARVAPRINPDELRRELTGSFPAPAKDSGPAARTARADEHGQIPPAEHANGSPRPSNSTSDVPSVTGPPLTLPGADDEQDAQPKPLTQAKQRASTQPAGTQSTNSPIISTPSTGTSPHAAAEAFGATSKSRAIGNSNFVRNPHTNAATAAEASRGKEAFGEALQVAGGGDPNVLASNQTPILTADIRGPKQILMGREALYRVRLQNQSDVAADGIIATVRIPTSAELISSTPTQGSIQQTQDALGARQLQWQLPHLDRRAGETLELRLVPRENRQLELGVSWTIAAVASRAVVEVQEAKLQVEIAGPNEVLFDKPQLFKLTLTNPGTGAAENVKIDLIPPGGKPETATSHSVGDLAAGASQTIEVELTARDAGKMQIKAIASAEGGLNCNATKEVFCRKPELEVDWRGPATKYVGTMATYYFRVRNPGTAPATDVTVHVTLPEGVEYTSASEGQAYDSTHRDVTWRVGTLQPGDDNYMELKCVLKAPGVNQFKIAASTAAGELKDNKTADTNVVALADLKLDVADPSGPVAVGAQAVYEIHVHNRGTSAARDVNVVGLFSDGIEPEQAEGATYTVTDGRVSFKTIEELPAGRDVVLRIVAHAHQPGTHVFRAEVLCRDLEIKLAAEETTRFYNDEVVPDGQQPPKTQATSRSSAFNASVR
jgi:uncharacterized repeat protein (TIGR01451 family)